MGVFYQDFRYAVRMMRKNPVFTGVAVITLALGIGANTAIFSVVNAVLLRPLPYREPEHLLRIWETNLARGGELEMTSLSNLLDWRRQNRSLGDVAAWQRLGSLTLTSQTPALELRASFVSANYFSLLGVPAVLGRTFAAEESTAGHKRVAVISDELWRRQFGSNPHVIGTKILLERQDFQVVGVIRTSGDSGAIAAEVRRATLELDPYRPPHSIVAMSDLISDSIARERFAMTWLGVLAAIALTLASVGIYSVLSHVTAQCTREVGIRLALGSPTSDVLKLVVRNGMTLTLIGVAIGLGGALALTRLIGSLLFRVTPNDLTTLVSASAFLIAVALLACYIPARLATKVDPVISLRYE